MVKLRASLLFSILALAATGFAADIIIESRAGGKNYDGYKETSGKWLDSNTPVNTSKSTAPDLSPQSLGSRKTLARKKDFGAKTEVEAAARFTPKIETAGDYHVYVTFSGAANATPVVYLIKDSTGETRKESLQYGWGAGQAANSNRWVDLGTFKFTPGGDQYVEIQLTAATGSVDPTNNAQVYADAVRFSTDAVPNAEPAAPAPQAVVTHFGEPGAKPAAPSSATASASATAPSSEPIAWIEGLTAGRSAATSQKKKMLVFFYSAQSTRSTDYEKSALSDPTVRGIIKQNFVPVKLNMDVDRDLAAQLQVYRAGTINVYDSVSGSSLESISNTPEASELAKRLEAVK